MQFELFHVLGRLIVDLSPSKCGFMTAIRGIALSAKHLTQSMGCPERLHSPSASLGRPRAVLT